jgi:hypothetical protein
MYLRLVFNKFIFLLIILIVWRLSRFRNNIWLISKSRDTNRRFQKIRLILLLEVILNLVSIVNYYIINCFLAF